MSDIEGITSQSRVELSFEELRINTAIRRALEEGASKVESLEGNPHYKAAFKLAARILRGMKPD